MSILGTLAKAGKELGEKAAEKGFDNLIKKGREELPSLAAKVDESMGVEGKVTEANLSYALDAFEEGKLPLLRLTNEGLALVAGHLENNDAKEARRVYIETKASKQERDVFRYKSGDDAMSKDAQNDAAWEAAEAVFKKVGKIGAKMIGLLALGAIGL